MFGGQDDCELSGGYTSSFEELTNVTRPYVEHHSWQ